MRTSLHYVPLLFSVPGRAYRYTANLLALDRCRAPSFMLPSQRFASITTPLLYDCWCSALRGHPDRLFASYITDGIRDGFRVGFQYGSLACHPTHRNMRSATQCSVKISEYLATECASGRVLGPFPRDLVPMVHLNRLGAVPKSTPGKYRLIVDLSYPEDHSVNCGIDGAHCSLSYVSVEDAAAVVLHLGKGALLAKVDIRNAYRNIPVHPDDRWLLGMGWNGDVYIDTVLPFGLRSAPKVFNSVVDAVEWVLRQAGVVNICHYLDDFLIMGPADSPTCAHDLSRLLRCLEWLGFPVAEEKVEGPASRLTFLGIEIDADALVLRLPGEKLSALRSLILLWAGRRWCRKRELQSLAGKLQHVCSVVRPGKSFLRRVFERLRGTHHGHHYIRINHTMRSDLAWWHLFLESWNGISILRPSRLTRPDHEFYSDAAGSVGCGAVWGCRWLKFTWPQSYVSVAIAPKELVPVVMACAVWGREWRGQLVRVHCDNEAVVAVLNSGYSKDEHMMQLVRTLFFFLAEWDIWLHACHIPGERNVVADAISRNNLSLLFSKVPDAFPRPTPIPQDLAEILVAGQHDWTHPNWGHLFRSCLQQV